MQLLVISCMMLGRTIQESHCRNTALRPLDMAFLHPLLREDRTEYRGIVARLHAVKGEDRDQKMELVTLSEVIVDVRLAATVQPPYEFGQEVFLYPGQMSTASTARAVQCPLPEGLWKRVALTIPGVAIGLRLIL
ncbi:hypothetical protein OE88DRAFT_1646224 [Heliocybe sulcata]|uniref:Uncharacterized protein n=1 Tax=Heliocybe sulcata TaxID=5364 RepID=A0A5C3N040_9AGAM|nr:hypothetical protein OE88DRAFT_1646224 [Heliocybe sulcata]